MCHTGFRRGPLPPVSGDQGAYGAPVDREQAAGTHPARLGLLELIMVVFLAPYSLLNVAQCAAHKVTMASTEKAWFIIARQLLPLLEGPRDVRVRVRQGFLTDLAERAAKANAASWDADTCRRYLAALAKGEQCEVVS